MAQGFKKGEGYVGFHGAGGGGSMMSMDSLTKRGLKLANFTDTSGNPPASKVYRAAKIILAQKNIDAYFGSGSGVASQEQFHSARGLVKAFLEGSLRVPVVIRLGGNQEDKAVQILEDFTKELPVPVKGYRKDDTADTCAETLVSFMEQVAKEGVKSYKPKRRPKPKKPYSWETVTGGHIVIDHARCMECESKICVEECVPRILDIKDGCPVLNITKEEAKRGKCIECLACEIDCRFKGNGATHIELPIPGLDAYLRKTAKGVSAKR
jgi:succinyl-CoA synthetase beta subunit